MDRAQRVPELPEIKGDVFITQDTNTNTNITKVLRGGYNSLKISQSAKSFQV